MIQIRRAEERGHANHGWLDTYHTFSFADYYDPRHMGFRSLRVINEDVVAPGKGFGMHPHRDMEIITYVLKGEVAHRDSLGTSGVVRPGEIQKMSAGTGILHSEFNPSSTEPLHLLQIWIEPARRGVRPLYEQKTIDFNGGGLRRLEVTMEQDASIFAARLKDGERAAHDLAAGRHAWVQVARGSITLNGQELKTGDGAAASGEPLAIQAVGDAEILLFDLA